VQLIQEGLRQRAGLSCEESWLGQPGSSSCLFGWNLARLATGPAMPERRSPRKLGVGPSRRRSVGRLQGGRQALASNSESLAAERPICSH